jgi:hypothetical protein
LLTKLNQFAGTPNGIISLVGDCAQEELTSMTSSDCDGTSSPAAACITSDRDACVPSMRELATASRVRPPTTTKGRSSWKLGVRAQLGLERAEQLPTHALSCWSVARVAQLELEPRGPQTP